MVIPAKYQGSCKDCGATHAIGDMIDKNGKESPNKMGEIKAHWCKNGTNCQGAQKFSENKITDLPQPSTSKKITDIPEPTPEQFKELGKSMILIEDPKKKAEYIDALTAETIVKIGHVLIQRAAIERAMNDLGLQHPSRIAFIKDVLRD